MAIDLSSLDARDWLVVAAALAGPVLAVQAQKWLELLREHRNRKLWLFHQLMASRAARESAEHVQALNMIISCSMDHTPSGSIIGRGRNKRYSTLGGSITIT